MSNKLRRLQTPEGMFVYDRQTGLCLFTQDVKSAEWTVPLYAQVALTEACNLSCWWCYNSSSPEKALCWPIRELKRLMVFLDSWGVLGVAFGGGEPFLYRHLVGIAKWTWLNTKLDVSVTTNGLAAKDRQIRRIEGYVSEVRVSVRSPSECDVLEKFTHKRFEVGVNLLLFRGGVCSLENIIRKCLKLGVNDFLINSFMAVGRGETHTEFEPVEQDFAELCRMISKYGASATFKVSGRIASQLKQLENLHFVPFEGEKRGRTIAITADKKVKPSSLSDEAYAFNNPEEVAEIYRRFITKGGS